MKIISWNVNGIRAIAKKGLNEFIKVENPDIFCIQETKAFEEQFIKEVGDFENYNYIWHIGKKPGYAGTAIFYKKNLNLIDKKNNFGDLNYFNDDGRITQLDFFYETLEEKKHIVLINGYFPNGGTRADGTEMLLYKLDFYKYLKQYVRNLKLEGKNVIILGDFNVCHKEIDIARPKENQNSIGFLPIEREKIGDFILDGNIDVWRELNPTKKDVYSWWSYRAQARPRNIGWRIDYFIVDKNLFKYIKDIDYMIKVEGSDHCPVKMQLK